MCCSLRPRLLNESVPLKVKFPLGVYLRNHNHACYVHDLVFDFLERGKTKHLKIFYSGWIVKKMLHSN